MLRPIRSKNQLKWGGRPEAFDAADNRPLTVDGTVNIMVTPNPLEAGRWSTVLAMWAAVCFYPGPFLSRSVSIQ